MDVNAAIQSIREDRNARASAEWLLEMAADHLERGEPLPLDLARAFVDVLEHFADTDPLAAFRHVLPAPGPGRPSKDGSKREQLEVFKQIVLLRESEGLPYCAPGDRAPFMELEGTVFMAFAERTAEGNKVAIRKEARRIQSAFRNHMDRLALEQTEAIGYPSVMRRPLPQD